MTFAGIYFLSLFSQQPKANHRHLQSEFSKTFTTFENAVKVCLGLHTGRTSSVEQRNMSQKSLMGIH